jgi:hypothetical protein
MSRALSPKRQGAKHARAGASGDEESDTTGGGASPPATAASGSFIALSGRAGSRSRYRTRRRRSSQPPELPELDKSDADFYRDWGISREREVLGLRAGVLARGDLKSQHQPHDCFAATV